VPRILGATAETLLGARGDAERLMAVFERSPVPMLMLDDRRRHVEANHSARLALRLSLAQVRTYTPDEVVPLDELPTLEPIWTRLLETGCVSGRSVFAGPDGGRMEVVYWGLANALPGLHLFAFAPADWHHDELGTLDEESPDPPVASLTPREREVLQLATEGLTGPRIAKQLVVSPTTVKTHFTNLYEKLGVSDRAAAVAKGIRLGLID
jgi:DNA-binding CsgD family transcriptional regulator